jgi:chemotaxis protein histidine kinase CheA
LTHDLEDKLLHLRLAPLASLSTRLQQAVRVTAREQGKRVTLHIEGDDVAFDKTVLETVAVPLLHVMRNAVAHGIEPPAQRQALGKAPQGQIYLRAFTTGMQMVIEVSDDGAGLDPQQLRAAAVCGGFMSEAAVAALSDTHLYQLIFLPGFSTAPGLSEVSGRGIGLDVVNATVKRLKGHVALIASRHQGLTFSIRLPMTLTLTRVLLVQVYDATFALPLADVIQLLPLEATAIVYSGDTACIQVAGQDVAVIWLGEHLQVAPRTASPAGRLAAVLLQAGTQQVACVVDHFLGAREVITKSLGNHLRRLPSVIGCTVLDAGQVVLILNPMALAPTTRPESTTC